MKTLIVLRYLLQNHPLNLLLPSTVLLLTVSITTPVAMWNHPTNNNRTAQFKVIGPFHPSLITSNMYPAHILPYSRKARAFVTTSKTVPRRYYLAFQCENKTKWMMAIEKELLATNGLKLWKIVDLRSD
ncbi:hypothetical protein O181_039181 [Austropuccinia psidii MF-1]|uniref:Uncharacterized protein n=1 Tax=Austropuccinia psidii MF-1 TaxID=1389203 RepID=A0A9Q3HCA9_9BASI|nr:hypothetical protein [Austropuccinia psidii MF-1]